MTIDLENLQNLPTPLKKEMAGRLLLGLPKDDSGCVRLETEQGSLFVFTDIPIEETSRFMAEHCPTELRTVIAQRAKDTDSGVNIDELIAR